MRPVIEPTEAGAGAADGHHPEAADARPDATDANGSTADRPDLETLLPLPRLAFQILLALARGELHGYAIAKEVERNTGGRTKPSTGSLYMSMEKLREQALIERVEAPDDAGDDARRRYFAITPLGRRAARAESERLLRLVNLARERDLLQDDLITFPISGEARG
jgi:DNA-binding PadR family transcriptional regulator